MWYIQSPYIERTLEKIRPPKRLKAYVNALLPHKKTFTIEGTLQCLTLHGIVKVLTTTQRRFRRGHNGLTNAICILLGFNCKRHHKKSKNNHSSTQFHTMIAPLLQNRFFSTKRYCSFAIVKKHCCVTSHMSQ